MNQNRSGNQTGTAGKVYLIGAGPGDSGLITVRGKEYLSQAEVVVFDFLSSEALLQSVPAHCERIYVGKQGGHHTLAQEEINRLLVSKAKEGKTVVRLKGGDPFVFGRGSEEALELVKGGIEFEIVPGITAGIAAAAYAGIPFTHRGVTSTAAFVTGHEMPGKGESDIDWESLSGLGTVAFYMGVKNLANIVSKLLKYGKSPNTPVALIRWGTLNSQETVDGTLENIVKRAEGIKAPAIIIVGDVVNLRKKLRWFDKRPLYGKRIVVTRSRNQASQLSAKLRALGAQVVEFPTIDIQPVTEFSRLDAALDSISAYSWIVFTSTNSVDIFFSRLFQLGYDSRVLSGVNIAVIGEKTGEKLRNFGLKPDLIPGSFTSEGTIEAFRTSAIDVADKKVLVPGSYIARDYIPLHLKKMGAEVDIVPIYENKTPSYSEQEIEAIFEQQPDLVTFTSSSTVSNLTRILEERDKKDYIKEIKGASIGPATSITARRLGIQVVLEALPHTIDSLVDAMVNKIGEKNGRNI